MGYSFQLAARVLLYAPSHRQDSTYHGLWLMEHWRNSSMGPPRTIDPMTHRTMSKHRLVFVKTKTHIDSASCIKCQTFIIIDYHNCITWSATWIIYLITHLTHFYHWLFWLNVGRKEGNVLFNDELNTLYLWLYGVRHMVKDHSDCKRGKPLPPHGLFFPISRVLYMHHPTNRRAYTTAFVTPVVEHWLEQEIAQ